jgi:hypothetical protein
MQTRKREAGPFRPGFPFQVHGVHCLRTLPGVFWTPVIGRRLQRPESPPEPPLSDPPLPPDPPWSPPPWPLPPWSPPLPPEPLWSPEPPLLEPPLSELPLPEPPLPLDPELSLVTPDGHARAVRSSMAKGMARAAIMPSTSTFLIIRILKLFNASEGEHHRYRTGLPPPITGS